MTILERLLIYRQDGEKENMATNEETRKQTDLCEKLSKRLYARIRDMDVNIRWKNNKRYEVFRWKIRLQLYLDIGKLRRELLTLGEMIKEE